MDVEKASVSRVVSDGRERNDLDFGLIILRGRVGKVMLGGEDIGGCEGERKEMEGEGEDFGEMKSAS